MFLVLLILASSLITSEEIPRQDAKAQRETHSSFAPLRLGEENHSVAIEIFQVLDLPLTVHEASLLKSQKGNLLRLSVANSSDAIMVGLRYALAFIDSTNHLQIIVNRSEGFSIPAYDTKSLTFKTPIRFKPKDGDRLVLMLEQVMSQESIWDVVKAKEAFEAYARGDYSVVPTVLRVSNQVDSPPSRPRVLYER